MCCGQVDFNLNLLNGFQYYTGNLVCGLEEGISPIPFLIFKEGSSGFVIFEGRLRGQVEGG